MNNAANYLWFFFAAVACHGAAGQHIQEIRKEVDPSFATREVSIGNNPKREPPDYKNWETLPSAEDYMEAYEYYNLFEGRLKKLLSDSIQKLDPQARGKLVESQAKWEARMHARCNKVWDEDFRGPGMMGSKVMLSYLYCISRDTKDRLVALGFDQPFNKKLDEKNALCGFSFDDDLKGYTGKVDFLKADSPQVKIYTARERCNVSGQPAKVSLWFKSNKLSQLGLYFSCPEDSVISAMTRAFGPPRDDPQDYVTNIRHNLWAGARATARYTTPKDGNKPVVLISKSD